MRPTKYKTPEEKRVAALIRMRKWWATHTADPQIRLKHRERMQKYRLEHLDKIREYKRNWQRIKYVPHPRSPKVKKITVRTPTERVIKSEISPFAEVRLLEEQFKKEQELKQQEYFKILRS